MQMQVETYEIEEINSSEAATMAADGEAALLIEKLGLTGQRKLLSQDTGTRFPYPRLTQVQHLVYSTCFPERCELSEYSAEIIPVRVMQAAAHAKDFQQAGYLEVWHSRLLKDDPILVGRRGRYDGDTFLLARWGNALATFEELQVKAREILRVDYQKKINQIKSMVHDWEANLDLLVDTAVVTGDGQNFNVYL